MSHSSIRPSVRSFVSRQPSRAPQSLFCELLLCCSANLAAALRTSRRYFTPLHCVCMSLISPLFFTISIFLLFWVGKCCYYPSRRALVRLLVSLRFWKETRCSLLFGTRGSGGRCQETISGLASGKGGERRQEVAGGDGKQGDGSWTAAPNFKQEAVCYRTPRLLLLFCFFSLKSANRTSRCCRCCCACSPVGGVTLFEKAHTRTHTLSERQMRRNMFHSVKTNKSSDGAASDLFSPLLPPPPPQKRSVSRRVDECFSCQQSTEAIFGGGGVILLL